MVAIQRIAIIGTGFSPTGDKIPPSEIAAIAGPGFRPELIETKLSVFPGTPYERGIAALGYIEAGIRAQDEGYDAVLINTFGDYGITELKSALRIPVVGAGESAMSLAAMLGRKFAIITIWPKSLNFIFEERVASCGMAARFGGLVNVLDDTEMGLRGTEQDPVVAMRGAKSAMIERIVAAAEQAIAKMGVDTIALGCTCMAPIGSLIAQRLAVPVVEPMTAGYAATEMLLSLGVRQSKLAFAAPGEGALNLARQLVGEVAMSTEVACEPCAIAAAAE